MKNGNKVFTGVLITGLVLGVGLMVFNSTMFNQIIGSEEEMQAPQNAPTSVSNANSQTSQDAPANAQSSNPQAKETIPGIVLTGTTTPYLEFTQAGYDQALKDKKVIVLNFYANWCPICRDEEPDVKAAFDSLNNPEVVGFQVNFKDNLTDSAEKDVAKQFAVPYQHTKVILKDGKEVLKETAQWDKDMFISQINAAL